MERTLVLIKPDGVERGLVGEIVSRFERRGLRLVAAQLRTLDRDTAALHYQEHQGKPFYDGLVDFITRGPLIHGSDSAESAQREIAIFFPALG